MVTDIDSQYWECKESEKLVRVDVTSHMHWIDSEIQTLQMESKYSSFHIRTFTTKQETFAYQIAKIALIYS